MAEFDERLGILPTTQKQYIDIDLKMGMNPVTRDINKKVDKNAINQAIKNLLLTNYFERPFNPKFGGNLYNMLFENTDPIALLNIRDEIKYSVEYHEPRVIVEDLVVTVDEYDEHLINVVLVYTTPSSTEDIEVRFQVERIR
jgi:phage baseplate assembly protein W